MKVEGTLVIMSLLGALSQPTKLLKVPRIYNALVTSDENLQPSQAYPALAPVVQGIQYPLVSSNVYRMLVIPNQIQYSDTRSYSYSVHNTVKEDYYHYNIVETGRPFKFDIPKILPSDEEKQLVEQPTLFRPVVPVPDENLNGNAARVNNDRVVYFESSPVQPDDSPPAKLNLDGQHNVRFQAARNRNEETNPPETDVNVDTPTLPELDDNTSPSAAVVDPKTDPRFGRLPEIDDVVKNYRPKDTSIVDVPPPPVPVSRKPSKQSADKKQIEEYPPPPVGFL